MYTFDSSIRYSEVDSEGRLTMASLINYFQDCSTFQSEDLGLGVAQLKERHLVWVLSSWQIVAERYPKLCETVRIGTLPYSMKAFLGYRNFVMLDEKGEYLAKAHSIWSLLDTETGHPVSIPDDIYSAYPMEEKIDMEYAPRKIRVPEGGRREEALTVKKFHLDTNQHVNNQKFLEIAMCFLPEGAGIRQVRAEYTKQAFLNDVLYPRVIEEDKVVVVSLEDADGGAYMIAEFTMQ